MFLEKLQEQQREVVALIKARQDVIARRAAETGSPRPLPVPPTTSPLRPATERATAPSTTPSQALQVSAAADANAKAQAMKKALAAAAKAPASPTSVSEANARQRKALEAKKGFGEISPGGAGEIGVAMQTAVLAMQTRDGGDAEMTQEAVQTSTTTGEDKCCLLVHF